MTAIRRAIACVVVAGVSVAVFMPVDVAAQVAASITETGWWSRNPAATAPAGGFQVASAPDGPVSVTALRVQVDATSLRSALLILSESNQVGTATLQVCPTTAAWSAAAPGPITAAPAPECGSAVALQRNEVQRVWTADVAAVLGGGAGQKSLVVVPGPSALPVPVPFQVDFAGAALQADGDVPPPSGATGDGAFGGGIADTTPFATDFSAPTDLGVAPSFSAPAIETPTAAIPSVSETATAAPAQVPGRFPTRGDIGIPVAGGPKKPWGRLPLLILAAAAVGAGSAVGRERLQSLGWLPSSS